jgi:serine/threonine protein kinase
VRFHARGGLGEVLVAEDTELHRPIALKRLQAHRADDADSRRRFLLEAQITGRLEHPGVVPVYGLVQDADGQPCYAMRYIEGESLKEAIERFHATEQGGGGPRERRLGWRQLLTRFAAVCHTVAYAHSRGIVHRDLKPANIMLGKYGETLVVDWGLAKAATGGSTDGAGVAEKLVVGSGDPGEPGTQLGQVAGTPAYMSPEQAAGRWDVVGPASDIYALGATLYALLTGRAPYQGRQVGEVVARVQRGDFPPLRSVQPATPRPLAAICLKGTRSWAEPVATSRLDG